VKPNAGRIFVGLFFIFMAIFVNAPLAFVNPEHFVEMGRNSLIPLYRDLFIQHVALNPILFVLPVAAYQIVVGLLILNRRRLVKIGLLAAIAFLLGISPLGLEELPQPILALTLATLHSKEFDTTFLQMIRAKLSSRQAHTETPE
jgi:hypothetical protein